MKFIFYFFLVTHLFFGQQIKIETTIDIDKRIESIINEYSFSKEPKSVLSTNIENKIDALEKDVLQSNNTTLLNHFFSNYNVFYYYLSPTANLNRLNHGIKILNELKKNNNYLKGRYFVMMGDKYNLLKNYKRRNLYYDKYYIYMYKYGNNRDKFIAEFTREFQLRDSVDIKTRIYHIEKGIQHYDKLNDYDKNYFVNSNYYYILKFNYFILSNQINDFKEAKKSLDFIENTELKYKKFSINNFQLISSLASYYNKVGNKEKTDFYIKEISNQLSSTLKEIELTSAIKDELIESKLNNLKVQEKYKLAKKDLDLKNSLLFSSMIIGVLSIIIIIIVVIKNKRIIHLNTKLSTINSQLLASLQYKKTFFNTISHELKTPITRLVNFVNLSETSNHLLDNYVANFKSTTNSLYLLLDKAIFLDELSENVESRLSNNFFTCVEEATRIDVFSEQEKNIYTIENSIPANLVFDYTNIKNFFHSIFFINKQKINNKQIKIKLHSKSDSFIEIQITNIDKELFCNLLEFSEQDISTVFSTNSNDKLQFETLNKLNFAIINNILNKYSGKIVENNDVISIIVGFTYNKDAELKQVKVSKSNEESKLLLVEDDKINQFLIKKLIENEGYACDLAENGQVAVDKVDKNHYDLILMDIMMPIMDGFEASSIISKINPNTPIVAISAISENQNQQKIGESGIVGFISKPINKSNLQSILFQFLQ